MDYLDLKTSQDTLSINFMGELSLVNISSIENELSLLDKNNFTQIEINLKNVQSLDTAVAIFLYNLEQECKDAGIAVKVTATRDIKATISLVKKQKASSEQIAEIIENPYLDRVGKAVYLQLLGFLAFLHFLGNVLATTLFYLKSIKHIRFKEIAFELSESGVKAFPIIALTSFLIGLVVAYQSAYQLKIYGANIFLVDMLGISILRELAPLITAIVIAGRSGSAFTAQIGAMKITEELDAMRTMGFDPYVFLVMPRIIALMIAVPLLIFVADMMAILGGMLVANMDLQITTTMFIDRFSTAVDAKHFFMGIAKGPFFAFLIASIGIYRGLRVKNDTQSIGFNTTKSVVEAIFAVIVCDAIFSIVFTSLGI